MSEKYDMNPKKTSTDLHDKAIKKLDDLKKLDEQNPMEQAEKYDAIKKNPPEPGAMKVEMFEKVTPEGEPYVESVSEDKTIKHNPFFTVDLNTAIMANIAACPSNVMPMLIDQAQRLAINKMNTFKPEKRNKEFNWWWIVFILLILAPVMSVILLLL